MVIKPGRLNVELEHLSRLETRENQGALDDWLPNANLFRIEVVLDHLEQITTLLTTGYCPEGYTTTQKRHLIVRVTDYQLIAGHLFKMGLDQVLRWCIFQHEREDVLWECHVRVAGGHVGGVSAWNSPRLR